MFTNEGLRLFAMWEQSPANKKRISSLAVGTLTDAQAEADDLYDGTETDLHNTTEYQRVAIDSVSVAETDDSVAIIRAIVTPASAIQGKTIREVGLFAPNENNVEQLIWIDKFPATYIPNPESEPDVQGSLVVTVPIKFNNATAIEVFTNNGACALDSDLTVLREQFQDYSRQKFVRVYATCSHNMTNPKSNLLSANLNDSIFEPPEDGTEALFHVETVFYNPNGNEIFPQNCFVSIYNSNGSYSCLSSSSDVEAFIENGLIQIYVPVSYHVVQAPMPVSVRGWVTRMDFQF